MEELRTAVPNNVCDSVIEAAESFPADKSIRIERLTNTTLLRITIEEAQSDPFIVRLNELLPIALKWTRMAGIH